MPHTALPWRAHTLPSPWQRRCAVWSPPPRPLPEHYPDLVDPSDGVLVFLRVEKPQSNNRMEERRINNFREVIRQIKQATIDGIVYETQDVKVLNDVKSRLTEIYTMLRDALKGQPITNTGISKLFKPILDPLPTQDERSKMLYYLRRDLIMFPLTPDPARINSVSENNSMERVEYGRA